MASFIFDQVKGFVATQSIRFVDNDGVYTLSLLDNTILDNPTLYSTMTKWSDISQFEITGDTADGYVRSPMTTLKGVVIDDAGGTCDDNLKDYKVSADNIIFNVSTITASCAVVTRKNTSGDDDLIVALDLRTNGTPVVSNKGVFTIRLDSDSGGYLIIK